MSNESPMGLTQRFLKESRKTLIESLEGHAFNEAGPLNEREKLLLQRRRKIEANESSGRERKEWKRRRRASAAWRTKDENERKDHQLWSKPHRGLKIPKS